MQLLKSNAEIIAFTPDMEKVIELAIRTCYKSEDRIEEGSAEKIML
ncbi:MAG: hypothetical protein ACD_33C00002G0026 [uncultured bacterium]|nr:MAG: hypothetical protein ACD_33C00002G0026 [uncultured bacterium]